MARLKIKLHASGLSAGLLLICLFLLAGFSFSSEPNALILDDQFPFLACTVFVFLQMHICMQ